MPLSFPQPAIQAPPSMAAQVSATSAYECRFGHFIAFLLRPRGPAGQTSTARLEEDAHVRHPTKGGEAYIQEFVVWSHMPLQQSTPRLQNVPIGLQHCIMPMIIM